VELKIAEQIRTKIMTAVYR